MITYVTAFILLIFHAVANLQFQQKSIQFKKNRARLAALATASLVACALMAYRKFSADRIFTGTSIIEGHTLVTTEQGTIIELIKNEHAGDNVEVLDGLLSPGFINTHCHTELSHMLGAIPENTGMVPFLMKVLFDRQADAQRKQEAMQKAFESMQANGIVAVGDICNTADSANAKAAVSKGIYCHNFIETSGFTPAGAAARFEQAVVVNQQFNTHFPAGQTSITPHAPYSVSAKLFELIAGQQPGIVSIHNQESVAEDDFIRNKSGELLQLYKAIGANIDFFEPQHTSSLQYMLPLLPKKAQVILVHNCHTSTSDIEKIIFQKELFDKQFYLCVCPNANLYIGNPLPNMQLLAESGLPICIGTDSLASNHQLSVLAELQILQRHFPFLPIEKLLRWATLNGAKALKTERFLGSFEQGKKPGLLLLKNITNSNLANAVAHRIL